MESLMKKTVELQNYLFLNKKGTIFLFESSVFGILPKKIKKDFSLVERIKLHLRALRGYCFYFLEIEDKMVAYCFLKRNYLKKYSFMDKNDLIVNPYYVSEEYRGNHFGEIILRASLDNLPANTKNVWAIVLDDNIPSIKTLERIGFNIEGYSYVFHFSHHISDNQTDKYVFKKVI